MDLNLFSLSSLFLAAASLISLFVSLFIVRSKQGLFWGFFKTTGLCWAVCGYFIGKATTPQEGLIWWRLAHIAIILVPIAFLHFTLVFYQLSRKKILLYSYLSGIFFISFLPSRLFIADTVKLWDFYYLKAAYIYPLFFLNWIFLASYTLFTLWKIYKTSVGERRLRTSYIFFGSYIWLTGCLMIFLPMFGFNVYPLGNLIIPIDCFLGTYVILKFRLIDLRLAVLRAVILTGIYSVIFIIPFRFLHSPKHWIFATCFSVLLASAGPFLFLYLKRKMEWFLLKEQHMYQNAIRELSEKMTRIKDLYVLLRTITSTVHSIGISFIAIHLKDNSFHAFRLEDFSPETAGHHFQKLLPENLPFAATLEKSRKPVLSEKFEELNVQSGLIVPIFIENKLAGIMILGNKSNYQPYSQEDILAFENLSYFTSLAIENCRFFKELEDRQRKARLQEMDTYSYSLAHEIDNPMQVILGEGWLLKNELLKRMPGDEHKKEAGESFDYILEAAKRVSGMVKAIRDFGQPTTGDLKPLKLDEVIDSFERLFYPQFKTNMITFEKSSHLEQPVWVNGEKPALMQVLVILANNSIHALKGSQERVIRLWTEILNDKWVRLYFIDNGCGIKEELLSVIFTPFTTTKASTEGSGMGLYNAKMIIAHHNGRIWAESEGEGKGARFVIELPVLNKIGLTESETNTDNKRIY